MLGRHYACWIVAAACCAGCQFVPASRLAAVQSQNRTLTEQSRAQLAEIENLKVHSRKVEDQLIGAEEQLAQLNQGSGGRQLASYKRGLVPTGVSGRLAELSNRYPSLQYDPETGVSKLDTDILFDSADDRLKPEAERMLQDFAEILLAPEASEMKIMVVGHTDNLKIAGRDARKQHEDNWRLSTSRALAVADHLRKAGLPDGRMGISGFGGHQPVSPNATALDRRKNRRVEIFVVGPEVPVVGWTETMTGLY